MDTNTQPHNMETTMSRVPKYRDDVKGNIAPIRSDFRMCIANEVKHSDCFMLPNMEGLEDTTTYEEFKDLLTDDEMLAEYKKAFRK